MARNFQGTFSINLEGAVAIESVSDDCVSMDEESKGNLSLLGIRVDKVEKRGDVLDVTVSVTTDGIDGAWSENSLVPASSTGKLTNISIDTSKFQLAEDTFGWYLPSCKLNLGEMTVEVLTPAFTGVEYADDSTTGKQTFTIHTQNMPENAKVEVALEKTTVTTTHDIEQAKIKKDATRVGDGKYSVTFDKNDFEANAEYYIWLRYGSDWAYPKNNKPTYTPNRTTGGSGSIGGPAVTAIAGN